VVGVFAFGGEFSIWYFDFGMSFRNEPRRRKEREEKKEEKKRKKSYF
jgi:hypothetical protein